MLVCVFCSRAEAVFHLLLILKHKSTKQNQQNKEHFFYFFGVDFFFHKKWEFTSEIIHSILLMGTYINGIWYAIQMIQRSYKTYDISNTSFLTCWSKPTTTTTKKIKQQTVVFFIKLLGQQWAPIYVSFNHSFFFCYDLNGIVYMHKFHFICKENFFTWFLCGLL